VVKKQVLDLTGRARGDKMSHLACERKVSGLHLKTPDTNEPMIQVGPIWLAVFKRQRVNGNLPSVCTAAILDQRATGLRLVAEARTRRQSE
jgi:hypothetical protein